MPIAGTDLYLETTNSDGYAIFVPPENVNHSEASVFTLDFVQLNDDEPLNLLTLIVRVTPTTSSFYVNTLHPSEGIVFEVTTKKAVPKGVYHFSLILFDPVLDISPPFPVDVTVTVASPGEFHTVILTDAIGYMFEGGARKE